MEGGEAEEFNAPPESAASSRLASPAAWCAGCCGQITERYLLQAVDRCWHTRCLKCHHCGIALCDLGSSCYSRGGMILCKNDYLRLFGSNGTCSGCSLHIPATEFVLRANNNVYHMQCFVCSHCRCQLQTGDRYALLNGQPVCESDFAKVFGGQNKRGKKKQPPKQQAASQQPQPPLQPVC